MWNLDPSALIIKNFFEFVIFYTDPGFAQAWDTKRSARGHSSHSHVRAQQSVADDQPGLPVRPSALDTENQVEEDPLDLAPHWANNLGTGCSLDIVFFP